MLGIEDEALAAVLQRDAGLAGDDAAAEAREQRVDERDHHAVAVDDGHVDGVGAGRLRHRAEVVAPLLAIDARGEVVDRRVGQHVLDGHVGHHRIGDEGVAHRVGETARLRHHVVALDRQRIGAERAEAVEDAQHDQRDDALVVRRHLVEVGAAVLDRDRLDVGRLLRGEVFHRVEAAEFAQLRHHVGGDLAGVEGIAALGRDGAQRLAELGELHDLADLRRAATGQQMLAGTGVPFQLVGELRPVVTDARRDDVTALGVLDRWRQHVGE